MSELMAAWHAKKAGEAAALHDRLRTAIQSGRVQLYSDQRALDFQGSPVHNGWDHLLTLMVMMLLALMILLAAGVAAGIVAMIVGALVHLLGTRYFVAWRLRRRTTAYMLASAAHWQHLWQLGGVAVHMPDSNEPPCMAPRGEWRKFVQRNLPEGPSAVPADAEVSSEDVLPP